MLENQAVHRCLSLYSRAGFACQKLYGCLLWQKYYRWFKVLVAMGVRTFLQTKLLACCLNYLHGSLVILGFTLLVHLRINFTGNTLQVVTLSLCWWIPSCGSAHSLNVKCWQKIKAYWTSWCLAINQGEITRHMHSMQAGTYSIPLWRYDGIISDQWQFNIAS